MYSKRKYYLVINVDHRHKVTCKIWLQKKKKNCQGICLSLASSMDGEPWNHSLGLFGDHHRHLKLASLPPVSAFSHPTSTHTTVEIHPLYIDILLSHDIAYTQTQTTHTPPHSSEWWSVKADANLRGRNHLELSSQ